MEGIINFIDCSDDKDNDDDNDDVANGHNDETDDIYTIILKHFTLYLNEEKNL